MLTNQDVPKRLPDNIRYREHLKSRGMNNPRVAQAIRESCQHDLLFWVNAFAWTYDPRKRSEKVNPFITWPFQDGPLLQIQRAVIEGHDILIEKSRDMGASWMCLLVLLHFWQFEAHNSFALISRIEDLVDKKGDPDSLFWKLDMLLQYQPPFLRPKLERLKLHLKNEANGSVIDGFSTTGNVLRGGRRTAALLDEFAAFEYPDGHAANAATHAATNCRIFNSTYKGATGAFYDQAQRADIQKVRIHWSDHPLKRIGLYYDARGKPRSPWYDKECQRLVVPSLIAEELDIDPAGAGSPFFPPELIERLLCETVREPYVRGRLDFDPQTVGLEEGRAAGEVKFREDSGGDLLLWMYPTYEGRVPSGDEFVVGADISAGTGATNSVLSAVNRRTGEKVGELATASLSPDRFGEFAVALCRWLHGAYLLWEMNGPGGPFGKRVIDLGYRNVYYRQNEQSLSKKATDTPGWFSSRDNKRVLLTSYAAALSSGVFLNRSMLALGECKSYVYLPTGDIGNNRAQNVGDPSGARENHGDRPTADALANKGLADLAVPAEAPVEQEALPGSLAYRRLQREAEAQKAKEW